ESPSPWVTEACSEMSSENRDPGGAMCLSNPSVESDGRPRLDKEEHRVYDVQLSRSKGMSKGKRTGPFISGDPLCLA
ncbi:hypothetical protein PENTCL1PPCAC_25549, partial [Pristionchus entomophagus]